MDKITLTKAALNYRLQNKTLNVFGWLATIKVIVCIFLGLYRELSDGSKVSKCLGIVDKHRIAWHPDPSVHGWRELVVGKGLRHWFYDLVPNATEDGETNGPVEFNISICDL